MRLRRGDGGRKAIRRKHARHMLLVAAAPDPMPLQRERRERDIVEGIQLALPGAAAGNAHCSTIWWYVEAGVAGRTAIAHVVHMQKTARLQQESFEETRKIQAVGAFITKATVFFFQRISFGTGLSESNAAATAPPAPLTPCAASLVLFTRQRVRYDGAR